MKKIILLVVPMVMMTAGIVANSPATGGFLAEPPVPEEILSNEQSGVNAEFSRQENTFFTPAGYRNSTIVSLSNGITFDTRILGKSGEPVLPADLIYDYDDAQYFIVQFAGPIYDTHREWLNGLNVQIHFYLPNYGFVVSAGKLTTIDLLKQNPAVNWVGIYQPAYKISHLFDMVGEEHKVQLLLFMNAEINEVVAQVATITPRGVFNVIDNGYNKIIEGVFSKDDIARIAHVAGVYWIEPYVQPEHHNSNVQWVVQDCQQNVRNIWSKGIRGEGEIVNTSDTGVNTGHYQHRSGSNAISTWGYYPTHNAIVAYDSGATSNITWGDYYGYHGTHTGGTICGNDTILGSSNRDGIAKNARLYFLDIGDASGTLYMYGDLNELYDKPYNLHYPPTRAYMSSNSWGAAVQGAYTADCQQVDQFMWRNKDFLLFFSNGNSGGPSGTVGSPASAKSVVSVGGCRNGTSYAQYYGTTSRGPTQDGRLKPTILTPALTVYSSTSDSIGYSGFQGTSMASPSAAGAGALIRQYLREGWYPTGTQNPANGYQYISASLVKAILINCADPNVSTYTVPDNNIGWGRVDLDSTLFFAGDARKTLLVDHTVGILTGEQVDYHFTLPTGAQRVKITLVWTDYPGNPVVTPQIVNDLDLVATVGGTYYNGNQYSGGQSVANPPGRDSLNVEECVRRNSPTSGDWLVSVKGRNVPIGPQPFSLVVSYTSPTVGGVVTIDKPVYMANDFRVDTVAIRVEDTNYGAAGSIDQVMVVIAGDQIETQPETLLCTELAANAYVFEGSCPLIFGKAVHGDDRLSVCQGDTITVTYIDDNPTYVSTTWAAIDASYFIIGDVHCENIEASMVDVCWQSGDQANSTVYYGTNPSSLDQVVSLDTPYVFAHRVHLTGLSPRTTYYYDVESYDFRGNHVFDSNGGNHYSFTTSAFAGVDILVALADGVDKSTASGQPLPGLRDRFRKAIINGGWTFTWWETSDHSGALPSREVMKNFKAVFVPCEDEYPPYLRVQQDTISAYQQNGGRIAFAGHDYLWYAWDYSTTPAFDSLWCKNYLHARYVSDITPVGDYYIYGVAGDPISGDYTSGVFYTPHRDGACADELVGVNNPPNGWDTGTSTNIWRWNSISGMIVGSKWESAGTHGTPGDGVWGGYRTRTVMDAFSATQMDTLELPDILNKTFIWLIGHDHPDVSISSPVTGNTYSSSPISIAWTATPYGGAAVDTTWIEYSHDGGQTWFDIASGYGMTSPYSWDVSTLSNSAQYQVKVTVSDRLVYPSMKGAAQTGNFTISIAGNDFLGPKVIPQSIVVQTNPMIVTPTDLLLPFTATATDSFTGLSDMQLAEWSLGSTPAAPGTGDAMFASDGAYNEIEEMVGDTLYCEYNPGIVDICTLWVRGYDAATNWGEAYMRTFTLIDGQIIIGIAEDGRKIPLHFSLAYPAPNPFARGVAIAYGIPKTQKVSLKIYNCAGQVVKTLEEGVVQAGLYTLYWNGLDDLNREVSAGIYFYRLQTNEYENTRKMVLVK